MKKKILLVYTLILYLLLSSSLDAAPWSRKKLSQEQIYSEGYGNILKYDKKTNSQQSSLSQNNSSASIAKQEETPLKIAQQLDPEKAGLPAAVSSENQASQVTESVLPAPGQAQPQPAPENISQPEVKKINPIPVPEPENPVQSLSQDLENKLFKKTVQAAHLKNYERFKQLKEVYRRTFPDLVLSRNSKALEALEEGFFYREKLNREVFPGSLLEITYPEARSFQEFEQYLKELNEGGFTAIQLEVTQYRGQHIFLFGRALKARGFYFYTEMGPVVDDLLGKIINAVHKNNMLIHVSLPSRTHPWINYQQTNLMDEYWNPLQSAYTLQNKLDLINPDGRKYLLKLIHSLIKYPIDGLIFKDDFTYSPNEGLSRYVRAAYYKRFAQEVSPKKLFLAKTTGDGRGYELLLKEKFSQLARWRTERIYLSFVILLKEIKNLKPELKVGVELTPEMLLDDQISIPWYSTGAEYLTNLAFDLFVLKWSKGQNETETDFESFSQAALLLKNRLPQKTNILLKVPLNEKNKNVVNLNDLMYRVIRLQEQIAGSKKIFGPLKRYTDLNLLHRKSQ